MIDSSFAADVAVIGGGPGGSTVATMLVRKGLRVVLLEREAFPRDHVGESLLPASMPVLADLGVLPAVEAAGFLPKYGATMVWGSQKEPWSWYFRETNRRYPHAYQVWRPLFDQLLLQNARAKGVEVKEGCRVTGVEFPDRAGARLHYTDPTGNRARVLTRFVVDASGSTALLSRQLDLRIWDSFFQNLAVYGYFSGADRLHPPDENNIFIESYAQGWLWTIPLPDGRSSVGAVVDSQTAQEEIQKRGVKDFFSNQIGQAAATSVLLKKAQLVSGPQVVRDWSYRSSSMVGDRFILVGDAACFVDPLFSSGVHLAMLSGVLGAAYVTSALKDPELGEAAKEVYQEMYYREYHHFRELAQLFYSSNRTVDSYFWEARRLLGTEREAIPRQAFIRAVAGQSPRGYERAVLAQGALPQEFITTLKGIQGERGRRGAKAEALFGQTNEGIPKLLMSRPKLATGIEVKRKPVLGDGEFIWGTVFTTPDRPEGTECSPLVSELIKHLARNSTVEELLAALAEAFSQVPPERLQQDVLTTLRILYIEGAIQDFIGP